MPITCDLAFEKNFKVEVNDIPFFNLFYEMITYHMY
jgi:hypothetical protein